MIVQILQNTPAWVWILLVALLYLGYLQSRTRVMSKARLLALPVAMVALSLYSLFATFGATRLGFAAWLISAALLYRVFRRSEGTGQVSDTRLYTIPGSWLPLTLMMAIFLTRYAVAVAIAIDASLRETSALLVVAGLAYGLLSCAFLARAHAAMRAAGHAPPSLAAQST